VVNSTPRLLYPSQRDAVPIVQEVRWALRQVWRGEEKPSPSGIRSSDRTVNYYFTKVTFEKRSQIFEKRLLASSYLFVRLSEGTLLFVRLSEGTPLFVRLSEGTPLFVRLSEGTQLFVRLSKGTPLFVRLSEGTPLFPLDGFSRNLTIEYFSKLCQESASFIKADKN